MGYLEDVMYVGEQTYMYSSLFCSARVLMRHSLL